MVNSLKVINLIWPKILQENIKEVEMSCSEKNFNQGGGGRVWTPTRGGGYRPKTPLRLSRGLQNSGRVGIFILAAKTVEFFLPKR